MKNLFFGEIFACAVFFMYWYSLQKHLVETGAQKVTMTFDVYYEVQPVLIGLFAVVCVKIVRAFSAFYGWMFTYSEPENIYYTIFFTLLMLIVALLMRRVVYVG